MTTSKEKALQFISDYYNKLQDLNEKVKTCETTIEYLQLEIRFLQEVDIPKGQNSVVLEGLDASHVTKLKNKLEKLQEQLQVKQEEKLILSNAIHQYKYQIGEKAIEVRKLFTVDKRLSEEKCYSHMMYAKKQYVDEILKQSETIRELDNVDAQLQYILQESGIQKNIYSGIDMSKSTDLQLSLQEVRRFITNQYSSNDYDYLKKYANKKDL